MVTKGIQLTLFQKALVLVAIPLFFELAFLATLNALLIQAEQQAEQAERAKAVIVQTNKVIQLLFDVSFAFVAYDAATNNLFKRRFLDYYGRVPGELNELSSLVSGNRNNAAIVSQVRQQAIAAMASLAKHKEIVEAGGRFDLMAAFDLRKQLDNMVKQLDLIIKSEQRAKESGSASAERTKSLVKSIIAGGVLVNIILAISLVFVFHKGTARRLNYLMENSFRLGKREELMPPLAGCDELANLDKVLHEASFSIAEVDRIKQALAQMISHDLRTSLTAVKGTLSLINNGTWGQLSEKGVLRVMTAQDSLNHSIELINNLLDLEKMRSGKLVINLEPCALKPILVRATQLVASLAELNGMAIVLPETEVQVFADPDRLTRVLVNLLGNALKFSPEKGAITLAIESSGEWVQINVRDQGPGIPPEHAKAIFEPYKQLPQGGKPAQAGTGLGLAICKAIIEGHGGEIGVESTAGEGSTFWFRIKVAST